MRIRIICMYNELIFMKDFQVKTNCHLKPTEKLCA